WARIGGEAISVGVNEALAVDGIDNVIRVLEEIENGRLPEVKYFEGLACLGGCVGGPLTFENMFIARNRIRLLAQMLPKTRPERKIPDEELEALRDQLYLDRPLKPLETVRLDEDFKTAMDKLSRIEKLRKELPGLDCGSCGSPTCQALAEDIVQGYATELNCIHLLKERLRIMASQMVEMSEATRE
ncbi:MAG: ferredoxin, partial [Clostridiales bacterium]|nr:ferredoxin [Clostridiales bacterium]